MHFDIQTTAWSTRVDAIKKGDEVIGNETRVKIVKNKVAPPFKQAEFEILYGEGVSHEGEIITLGVAQGIIEKSGSWYSFEGERIGQGRENVKRFLAENPDIQANALARVRQSMGLEEKETEPETAAESSGSAAIKALALLALSPIFGFPSMSIRFDRFSHS